LGRLHALGAFEVPGTPTLDDRPSLEEQINRLKDLIGIDEQTMFILLEETPMISTPHKAGLN
jgi:hypothetical protein